MKKIIISLCIAISLFAVTSLSAFAYVDMVDENHWGYAAMTFATENGIIKGFEDDTVRPNDNLTRAQMAAIIVRLSRTTAFADMSQFTDVDENAWYYQTMETAVGLGLFLGNGDGHLYPDNAITRQEAFTVVARFLEIETEDGETDFTDDAAIASWAKGYIKSLKSYGFVSGDNEKNVNPSNTITRMEFAQLIFNIYSNAEIEDTNTDKNNDNDDNDKSTSTGTVKTGSGKSSGKSSGGKTNSGSSEEGGSGVVIVVEDDGSDVIIEDIFDDLEE